MGRSLCCDKIGLKKGPWTPEEDEKLLAYIQQHGHGSWRALPSKAGLQRCGKSCRLRWTNYLRPDIKRGKFSLQEEQTIIQLHALLGNRWSAIATHMPKRTDNEIKNYWNTHLKKRLTKMGIDPVTHKPKNDALLFSHAHSKLSHMAQWETARLQAEARLRSGPFQVHQRAEFASTSSQIPKPIVGLARCMDMQKAWNDGDLESPTSTLIPTAGIRDTAFIELTRKEECEEDWKHQLAEIRIEGIENSVQLLHETASFQSGWESMSENGAGEHVPFVDKFTDLLLSTSSGDRGLYADIGDSDNKNYWNSILNLVNSPPSDDSPMF